MAPEVIVEHVSAKANWNRKNARNATPVDAVGRRVRRCRKKYSCPIQPLPVAEHEGEAERAEQEPAQHGVDDALEQDVETSRVRAKPASSIMKPACMKNTRNAATQHPHGVQAVDRACQLRPSPTPPASAGAWQLAASVLEDVGERVDEPPRRSPRPMILPPSRAPTTFRRTGSRKLVRSVVIMRRQIPRPRLLNGVASRYRNWSSPDGNLTA